MASGRQLAEQNAAIFAAWVASKTDDDFRAMASRGVLSRAEVATECGFSKSVLNQNLLIKPALRELEDDLRHRGILPPTVAQDPDEPQQPAMREPGRLRAAKDTERLRRLEQENASLKAEVAELKRALEKHAILRDALALTGRLPR
jgi:hypothetical protein